MEFFIGSRRSGKTTKLIEWLKEQPENEHRVIVCMTASEADRIRKLCKEQDMDIRHYQIIGITQMEYLTGASGHKNIRLALDNFELIKLLPYPVDAITTTGDVTIMSTKEYT